MKKLGYEFKQNEEESVLIKQEEENETGGLGIWPASAGRWGMVAFMY